MSNTADISQHIFFFSIDKPKELLCFECATFEKEELHSDVNLDDPAIACEHCGEQIPSQTASDREHAIDEQIMRVECLVG